MTWSHGFSIIDAHIADIDIDIDNDSDNDNDNDSDHSKVVLSTRRSLLSARAAGPGSSRQMSDTRLNQTRGRPHSSSF